MERCVYVICEGKRKEQKTITVDIPTWRAIDRIERLKLLSLRAGFEVVSYQFRYAKTKDVVEA
ncbi:MAG TPA: hypothetical protein PK916_13335 [Bacteroidota bacterium]|nr:hypothetical protein [Bacteroidota bacterium]